MEWDTQSDELEYITRVLSQAPPTLPPTERKLGAAVAQWWEAEPGKAVIMATGGTCDDRTFAEQMVKAELGTLGYERVAFTFDVPSALRRTADWTDIMSRAKRLIQSGNVTILRNGYNNIVGHVVGDHGEYNTEIGRDDPNSRTITTWQCDCPWDQYAWQRTRKWKRYEGRPCAHVMALYWKSLATPLDEDISPEQAQSMGTGQRLPGAPAQPNNPPPVPAGAGGLPPNAQGLPDTGAPTSPPSFGPAQAPMAPPMPADVLPPAPMEQQALPLPMPGTTPSGTPAPPNSLSVPGARPPSPMNPIQYPGGTYSAVQFQPDQTIILRNDVYGLTEGRDQATDSGQYQNVPAGTKGSVIYQDPTTGWVEAMFPLSGGPMTSYHVRCFLEPGDLKPSTMPAPGPFIQRQRAT